MSHWFAMRIKFRLIELYSFDVEKILEVEIVNREDLKWMIVVLAVKEKIVCYHQDRRQTNQKLIR